MTPEERAARPVFCEWLAWGAWAANLHPEKSEAGEILELFDLGMRAIEEAIAYEREACARLVDAEAAIWDEDANGGVSLIARAIRARGEAPR